MKWGSNRAESLNVMVSRSCDRTKFSWVCAKSWWLCAKTKNVRILPSLFVFFFKMIHTYYVSLGMIFPLFLAQNFQTKVLTVQKKSTFRMSVTQGCILDWGNLSIWRVFYKRAKPSSLHLFLSPLCPYFGTILEYVWQI